MYNILVICVVNHVDVIIPKHTHISNTYILQIHFTYIFQFKIPELIYEGMHEKQALFIYFMFWNIGLHSIYNSNMNFCSFLYILYKNMFIILQLVLKNKTYMVISFCPVNKYGH